MRTLPPPIQRYLGEGKYSIVANHLMTKYSLHIDQGGILEREIMLLLMGIENPDEFTKTLAEEAKLDQQTINNIVKDVNDQIFVPLRDEMRNGPQAVPQMQKPATMSASRPSEVRQQTNVGGPPREVILQPRTTIIPANPQLPTRPAQTLASVPRYVPPKKYFNLQNKIPPPVGSQTSTMREGSLTSTSPKLLEDHEEPHIDISAKVQVASSSINPPPVPALLKPSNLPLTPSAEPYSADPYREPIEP